MSEKHSTENESTVGSISTLAMVAGLAVNLIAPVAPLSADQMKERQLAAERFAQTWGDCVDE